MTSRNLFRLEDGRLDKQYLRVCATYKLLKLCRIDAEQAVELLLQRGVRTARANVSHWVAGFEKNEWHETQPQTILGAPYSGPRPR